MNVFAAVLQSLVALAFLSIPLVRARHGAHAMAAAEAELTRQGVRPSVLTENGMRFDAGGHETWAPVTIAAAMLTGAGANLAGVSWAGPVTWTLTVAVVLVNAAILHSNLTAVRSVTAAFARKGGELARIDVRGLLTVAENAFPTWVRILQNARHAVVFGGALGALALIAL
ncbi:hypothetical protein ACN20G_14600 [Streptomyces sp. BI20]|uniref:hypothetical protein n=1 Tax=Streptomyces sp. BI20 TaxID=3403460 RepID=UPI003C70E8D4